MPNHPAVVGVLQEAGRILESSTGDSSLEGYQSGPERAAKIGQAIYQALKDRRIGYINPPASFENCGQKIRTPEQVLDDGLGTCLDLACTYAACLEQAGLDPLVYFIHGHAYAGFFTRDDLPLQEASIREHAISLTLQEAGIAIPVETTGFTDGKDLSFDDAARIARRHIDLADSNHALIDVKRARYEKILPLPVRVRDGNTVTVIVSEPAPRVPAPAPTAPTKISARSTAADRTPARMRLWKSALLDMSFRNPLLHLRDTPRSLNLLVPANGLGLLENVLMEGQAIQLLAFDQLTELQRQRGARSAADIDAEIRVSLLSTQQIMFVETEQEALRRRCRALMAKAREAEEENGTNILHLTIGSLVWIDPKTGKEIRSPILLLPVRLRSAGRGKPLELVADPSGGTASNHCLLHKLRLTFNLEVPELTQLEADAAGIDVDRALNGLRAAILEQGLNMRVDEDAALALLEFGKFRMWKDLDDHWERFHKHPVINHLVDKPGETYSTGPGLPAPHELDSTEVFCPIPCDGTQLEAIVAAARGASFVLEGPPGTGKSQTITNLVANALASGKRVLFVAEKRAALNVVKNRLSAVGLGPFCLDIHGKDSSPKQLREQLNASLDAHFAVDEGAWHRQRQTLGSYAARLRAYAEALHVRGPQGLSAWEAREALVRLGPGDEIQLSSTMSAPQIERVSELLRRLPTVVQDASPLARHPWRMLRDPECSDRVDRMRLRDAILTLREALQQLAACPASAVALAATARSVDELRRLEGLLSAIAALPSTDRRPELLAVAASASSVSARRDALSRLHTLLDMAAPIRAAFIDGIFREDTEAMADRIEEAERGFFLFKKGRVAEALSPVQPFLRDRNMPAADVIRRLRSAAATGRHASAVTAELRTMLAPFLPATWSPWDARSRDVVETLMRSLDTITDAESDASIRQPLATWMADGAPTMELMRTIAPVCGAIDGITAILGDGSRRGPFELPIAGGIIDTMTVWASAWAADAGNGTFLGLRRWCALLGLLRELEAAGFPQLARDILTGTSTPDTLQQSFARGVARAALVERFSYPPLSGFDGLDHSRAVREFIELQARDAEALRSIVPARLLASRPFQRGQRFGEVAELARNELARQKGGMGIRGLLRKYARAIHELTPCFLMSPDSVAQYLEPGVLEFDIVVFDEASQVPVGDAIGAIARGKSLVVVGDSRQMPPTSFFGGGGRDSEAPEEALIGAATEDLESILSECVASGLPRVWLSWHYRSQDESLIAFSNQHYYEGRLSSFPPPAATGRQAGVLWRRVQGVFDRGRTRTNAQEATAVVAEVCRLLDDPATRSLSIGVVTFNIEQQDLVIAELEEAARANPVLDAALRNEDPEQRLFVKNLESVQGDERDVILMSVGFGRDSEGRMTMNFGPLNRPGGERRWNVAVTRARRLVVVFSSIDPEDIELNRLGVGATGVRHLRAYLEMARDGVETAIFGTSGPSSQDLHRDEVARVLREAGLIVATDLGLSSFRVDLAVAHPDAPEEQLVAVLLDGPGYASRRTVQDRDGLPVGVLQQLMRWPATHRIWLPEWLDEPDRVVADLRSKVDELHQQRAHRPVMTPSSEPPAAAPAMPPATPPAEPEISALLKALDAQSLNRQTIEAEPTPPPAFPSPSVSSGPSAPSAPLPPVAPTVVRDQLDQDFRAYVSPRDIGTKDDLESLTGAARAMAVQAIHEVIAVEAPIAVDRLARLVARRYGLARVRQARVDQLTALVPSSLRLKGPFGEFVWSADVQPGTWQAFRRTPSGSDRDLDDIAPEEIRNAMVYFARKGMSISEEGVLEELAATFDIQRLSGPMRDRLLQILEWTVARGDLQRDGDRLIAVVR
jgi:hypothetical protein